uniref:glucan endo-1,3-beta-D-glucosidase n=1 Tax=Fagus sylvatica TaxID=28930 RepID=A0A2N9G7U6_FAGSY
MERLSVGNNLPPPGEVIEMYKQNNFQRMRLYGQNQDALQALRGTNIELMLGVPDEELQNIASSQDYANTWIRNNVQNYGDVKFRYIAVGNEIRPDGPYAQFLFSAMQNIQTAIYNAGLGRKNIKVSTPIYQAALAESYPPSKGSFTCSARWPTWIPKIFYAILDAFYSALEKANGGSLNIVVSETGWPFQGGQETSFEYASTYNSNLIRHVMGGTPKRPAGPIETYMFAMFNENEKNPDYEKNWGLFYPNKQPKYQIKFNEE